MSNKNRELMKRIPKEITSKDDAIRVINLISAGKKMLDELKSQATEYLLNNYKNYSELLDDNSEYGVTKIDKYITVYNSAELEELEKELKELQDEIKELKLELDNAYERGEVNEDGSEILSKQLQTTYFRAKKL